MPRKNCWSPDDSLVSDLKHQKAKLKEKTKKLLEGLMSSKWQERPPRLVRDVLAYPKLQVDLGLKGRWFHKTSMAMTWGGPWGTVQGWGMTVPFTFTEVKSNTSSQVVLIDFWRVGSQWQISGRWKLPVGRRLWFPWSPGSRKGGSCHRPALC
jgi:hypothetical protein